MKIVPQFYKSWSFIANAAATVVGIIPDLINLLIAQWSMVDALPTLSPGHKLVLFGALHVAAMILRAIKQKNMPAPSIPVATVNVPATIAVPTGAGGSVEVQTDVRVVDPHERVVIPSDSRAVSFDELIAYGVANAPSLVDGVPWSFTFEGRPVTHEHDDLYLVGDLRFARGDTLWIRPNGGLVVEPAAS